MKIKVFLVTTPLPLLKDLGSSSQVLLNKLIICYKFAGLVQYDAIMYYN